jgi:2-polyprenyl-3-methyl-5-hydroxy-6-metoxy-1,4-benzoquinol methylase
MPGHICPWWGGFFIDNPLRRLLHDPAVIVGPYVTPGMTVMDVGCGMGFLSLAMARMVGAVGMVIAVDLQQRMLDVVTRRAAKAGLAQRIRPHRCQQDRLDVDALVDFAVAMMMVHEVPDQRRLLGEIRGCLVPGGKLLIAEPRLHVSGKAFAQTVATAREVGFQPAEGPRVHGCRAVILDRGGQ